MRHLNIASMLIFAGISPKMGISCFKTTLCEFQEEETEGGSSEDEKENNQEDGFSDDADNVWTNLRVKFEYSLTFVILNCLLLFFHSFEAWIAIPAWSDEKYFFFFVNKSAHWCLSKHETLSHCWFNVGPPSTTLAQHWTNNGLMSRVRWVSYFNN